MDTDRKPGLEYPVQDTVAGRWSPYCFADKRVGLSDLRSIFEAARWAPSAFNEQPWRYLVATRDKPDEFAAMLSCLVEANQAWAGQAPVLALAVVGENYTRNGKPNGTARHDLGLAAGNICLEAAARGIMVHQMAGILPDRARELYRVPEGFTVFTALALGYAGEGGGELAARDKAPRERRPQHEFVFGGAFGEAY